jgi:hypothetical protein
MMNAMIFGKGVPQFVVDSSCRAIVQLFRGFGNCKPQLYRYRYGCTYSRTTTAVQL